jgi:hypothetical protein
VTVPNYLDVAKTNEKFNLERKCSYKFDQFDHQVSAGMGRKLRRRSFPFFDAPLNKMEGTASLKDVFKENLPSKKRIQEEKHKCLSRRYYKASIDPLIENETPEFQQAYIRHIKTNIKQELGIKEVNSSAFERDFNRKFSGQVQLKGVTFLH